MGAWMRSTWMAVALTLVAPIVAEASKPTSVPVLLTSPTCKYRKLGSVSIEAGNRVSETNREMNLPTVDYDHAFAQLANAAREKGANAVVIYWHKAAYFTRFGRRTRKPVYVRLSGGAIEYEGEAVQCRLVAADPEEFARRAEKGEPVNVTSDQVYSGE